MTNHYTDVCEETIESLRQQLASLKNEIKSIGEAIDDPRTDLTMTMSEIIRELKQQLAAAQADNIRLREALEYVIRDLKLRADLSDGVLEIGDGAFQQAEEALAATADLKDVILCHAEPTIETLSIVTNTGYVYVRAIDRKVEPNTKLFSAWEQK